MNEELCFRAVIHFESLALGYSRELCKRGHSQESQIFVNRLFIQLHRETAYYLLVMAAVCSCIFYTKPYYFHATG